MPGVLRTHQISVQDHRLHYLYIAASHGSMRAAADLLGIAASSISRQIAQLERDLRIDLVETGAHKMRLTEAGRALVDYYIERLRHHDDLLKHLSELRRSRSNLVRIAFGEGILRDQMVASLSTACNRHDDTTVDLISTSSYEVQNMVRDGGAHIGIVFETPDNVRLRVHGLLAQPIKLICSPDNPVAASDQVDLEAITQQRIVMPTGGLRLAEILYSVFGDAGLALNPVITSNTLQPIIDAVKAGIGVTLLPEIFVLDELRGGRLVSIEVGCAAFADTQISIITRLGQRLSPAGLDLLTSLNGSLTQSQFKSS